MAIPNSKLETRNSPIWRPAIALTLFFVVVMGLAFPFFIWGISQAVFPHQANGSLIKDSKGSVIGSELIGQMFTKPEYFHPRPSAAGSGYDAANSSGTNLGPTSDKLINGIHDPKNPSGDFDGMNDLAKRYRAENGLPDNAPVPADAITRSGSGLDPDISIENARLQVARIARVRGLASETVQSLIDKLSEELVVGVFGDAHVNVLHLNQALDRVKLGALNRSL